MLPDGLLKAWAGVPLGALPLNKKERKFAMQKTIKVALLGLGKIGQEFAENFLEMIQERKRPVEIVAVSDLDTESPVALGFAHSGVPVFAQRDEKNVPAACDRWWGKNSTSPSYSSSL